MGKLYTVTFTAVAITAQQDLFEITAASSRVLLIHGVELSQSTEVGDAAEEGLAIVMKRGTSLTTSGSGGSSATPAPLEVNQGAAGSTAEVNNTTKLAVGTGAITTLIATNWNIRATPMAWMFTPELRPVVSPSERFAVELATTPADSITTSGTLWFEEIG